MAIRTDNDTVINDILPGRPALAAALFEAISNPAAPAVVLIGHPSFAKSALLATLALIAGHEARFDPASVLPVFDLERSLLAVDVLGDAFLLKASDVNFAAIIKYSNESTERPVATVTAYDSWSQIASGLRLDMSDRVAVKASVERALRAGAVRFAA